MNGGYPEEEFLNLSGLQHFAFCRRQWALIEIEGLWRENLLTTEGHLLHERAHDPFSVEKRGSVLFSRAMPVFSRTLGVRGVCDVVELHATPDGVPVFGREGLWLPHVVEYKRGAPKEHDADRLQLCCQALCLEEMLGCTIEQGSLFYGETARRTPVPFDEALRAQVCELLAEMHALYCRQHTPRVRPNKGCRSCSLKELCLPKLSRSGTASQYIASHLKEDAP